MIRGRSRAYQDATDALDRSGRNRRLLYIFSYVATLIGLQILHLALDDIPMLIGLNMGVAAGFIYSYFLAPRHRAWTTYGVSIVACVLSLYYFMHMRENTEMLANYLGILLGVLTVLLAFKAFAPSDHRFILLVCVVFLLYSSAASYDIKFMLLLPIFLIFAGLVLYISNQFDISTRVDGRRNAELSVRSILGGSFLGILVRAVIGVILLSILAYIFTPHSGSGQHSLALKPTSMVQTPSTSPEIEEEERENRQQQQGADSNVAKVGLGDEFDLSGSSELESDPRPVLKVRSRRNGYMRAKVYPVYTGSGWEEYPRDLRNRSGADGPDVENPGRFYTPNAQSVHHIGGIYNRYSIPVFDFPDPAFLANRKDWGVKVSDGNINSTNTEKLNYDLINQEVTFLEEGPGVYLGMYQPLSLENVSKSAAGKTINQPVFNREAIIEAAGRDKTHPRNFSYLMVSLEPRVGPGALDTIITRGPEEIVDLYTQLPMGAMPSAEELAQLGIEREQYRPISDRMVNFARKFERSDTGDPANPSGDAAKPWQIVNSIYEYLTDPAEFTYTRNYKPLDENMEITEAFCLGTREGYCRYFASSMAVMCRINGIPARVVTGYKPGSFDLLENANVYKASDAHAWVEVYFDGYGWLTFDPSPASQDMTRQEATQWIGAISDFLQELFVIDPASTQQMLLGALRELWDFMLRNRAYTVGLISMVLLLALLWWARGKFRIPKRAPQLRPENEVVAAYLAVQDELRRLGLRRPVGSTVRSFASEAGQLFPAVSAPLERLTPVYERAAFAPLTVTSEEAGLAATLAAEVASFVSEETRRRKQR